MYSLPFYSILFYFFPPLLLPFCLLAFFHLTFLSCCDGYYYSFVDMFGYIPVRIPVVVYILLLTFLFLLYRYADELSTVYFSCFPPPLYMGNELDWGIGWPYVCWVDWMLGCLPAYFQVYIMTYLTI